MATVNDNYPKNNDELSDAEIKQLAIQNMQRQEVRNTGFPTEIIPLPSKGLVYPEGNPLREGQIEMKYMTAKEEDILTSQNLIKQGVALDKLMQSLIVSPIKYNDLLIGDKNAIMIASRILGYGKQYEIEIECPKCEHVHKMEVDLTTLPTKEIPDGVKMKSPNEFVYTLPQSKRVVTFKLLTHGDEKKIQYAKDAQKKTSTKDSVDRELTTRFKHIILSVDDNYDKAFINHFVDNELFAMDSRALRSYMRDVSPDQKFEIDFECQQCSHEEEALAFTIDTNFFWPKN
jgi:hypothetical protein